MKLLLENWRSYTQSLLNEDLLIESYEDAKKSVVARASKWFKGYVYQRDLDIYNTIEEKIKQDILAKWGKEYNKQTIEEIKSQGYVYHWDIAGYCIHFFLQQSFVPVDITDKQAQVALLWSYRQLISDDFNSIKDKFVFSLVLLLLARVKGSKSVESLSDTDGGEASDEIYSYYWTYFGGPVADTFERFTVGSGEDEEEVYRKNLIERFFQMNRFIRNGKRDLNAVSDFNELYELVNEARPLYQAWQEKQADKDAEAGKELLLDDQNWQVIAIHNKGAACQLGKGTDWCTAAPGLEYFKQYYRPDDPLFYILDKSDGEKYQFHFGTGQFMDRFDDPLVGKNVPNPRFLMFKKILEVLDASVPSKYEYVRRKIASELRKIDGTIQEFERMGVSYR